MFICPACGATTAALETRAAGKGPSAYVRRRRACTQCHKRITTREMIVESNVSGTTMIVPTATMAELLRLVVSTLAPGAKANELVTELLVLGHCGLESKPETS